MPTKFQEWRIRHKLTQEAAGAVLGRTRRMIGQYDRGDAPVPPVVCLAMKGYDAAQGEPNGCGEREPLAATLNDLEDAEIVANGSLTPLAEHVAAIEGWGVFWNPRTERLEIERDDKRRTFANDAEARRHVVHQARAGMKLHRAAMLLHGMEEEKWSKKP